MVEAVNSVNDNAAAELALVEAQNRSEIVKQIDAVITQLNGINPMPLEVSALISSLSGLQSQVSYHTISVKDANLKLMSYRTEAAGDLAQANTQKAIEGEQSLDIVGGAISMSATAARYANHYAAIHLGAKAQMRATVLAGQITSINEDEYYRNLVEFINNGQATPAQIANISEHLPGTQQFITMMNDAPPGFKHDFFDHAQRVQKLVDDELNTLSPNDSRRVIFEYAAKHKDLAMFPEYGHMLLDAANNSNMSEEQIKQFFAKAHEVETAYKRHFDDKTFSAAIDAMRAENKDSVLLKEAEKMLYEQHAAGISKIFDNLTDADKKRIADEIKDMGQHPDHWKNLSHDEQQKVLAFTVGLTARVSVTYEVVGTTLQDLVEISRKTPEEMKHLTPKQQALADDFPNVIHDLQQSPSVKKEQLISDVQQVLKSRYPDADEKQMGYFGKAADKMVEGIIANGGAAALTAEQVEAIGSAQQRTQYLKDFATETMPGMLQFMNTGTSGVIVSASIKAVENSSVTVQKATEKQMENASVLAQDLLKEHANDGYAPTLSKLVAHGDALDSDAIKLLNGIKDGSIDSTKAWETWTKIREEHYDKLLPEVKVQVRKALGELAPGMQEGFDQLVDGKTLESTVDQLKDPKNKAQYEKIKAEADNILQESDPKLAQQQWAKLSAEDKQQVLAYLYDKDLHVSEKSVCHADLCGKPVKTFSTEKEGLSQTADKAQDEKKTPEEPKHEVKQDVKAAETQAPASTTQAPATPEVPAAVHPYQAMIGNAAAAFGKVHKDYQDIGGQPPSGWPPQNNVGQATKTGTGVASPK